MAILKMKKLRLMAVRSEKEALLKELIRHGCVEFSELEGSLEAAGTQDLVMRESSDIPSLRARQTALNHAVALLAHYCPEKTPLLSAKTQHEDTEFISDEGIEEAADIAARIESLDGRIKRISGEESREKGIIESMQPWLSLDMPLECEGTERCGILTGTFPVKTEAGMIESEMAQITDEAELFCISEDKRVRYAVIVCIREKMSELQEKLRTLGFAAVSFSSLEGTPAQCVADAQSQIEALTKEKAACTEELCSQAVHRDELKLASDRLGVKIALAEANDRLYGTEETVVMGGWFPEEREAELEEVFSRFGCAWESEEPSEEEYPDVPVKLKNNKITNALNMVTDMYSLPAYGSLDPNPLMAPFFILFYGLMMADMGYGLIMIAAALVALKKIKPREGTLSFCQLLLYGGISTFIMGALTGGFFGDALEQIGKICDLGEGWGKLPALFSPMTDSMTVLIGAMALGMIHLNTGMVINVVKKVRRGQIADAVWEEGALWVTLIGIILFVLKIGNIADIPVILIVGLLMVFYGGSRGSTGFGKIISVFSTLYNTATGWFGDILSYSRIMALMLAGSVIATVFNTIGGIANSLWLFIPVFIIGHGLNFALNLLGCYVHDLRLQCLEYFGKFYEDGGRAFAPLKVKSKYYDVAE